MLIDKIPIVDIIDGGWCNVQWAGNIWGVVFVRVLPFLFISIPGSLIACRYRSKLLQKKINMIEIWNKSLKKIKKKIGSCDII